MTTPSQKVTSKERMRKFEYYVVNHTSWILEEPDKFNGNWFQDRLDKLGKKGWEMCGVDNTHVYFKKELK